MRGIRGVVVMAVALAAAGASGHAPRDTGPYLLERRLEAVDVILRAEALSYVDDAQLEDMVVAKGLPRSWGVVEFLVKDVLKGDRVPDRIGLHGVLTDEEVRNDGQVPFVRSRRRERMMSREPYVQGEEYLLCLRRLTPIEEEQQGFVVMADTSFPNNEPLSGPDDPWVLWVKGFLAGLEYAREYVAEHEE